MTTKLSIEFKFEVGSTVYYEDEAYFVLSRHYMETPNTCIIKYNLRKKFDEDVFLPNVWEDELKYKPTPPLRIVK